MLLCSFGGGVQRQLLGVVAARRQLALPFVFGAAVQLADVHCQLGAEQRLGCKLFGPAAADQLQALAEEWAEGGGVRPVAAAVATIEDSRGALLPGAAPL